MTSATDRKPTDYDVLPNRKPERDFEGKPRHDRPGPRPCLRCGKPFASDGWHNRLCSACKGRG